MLSAAVSWSLWKIHHSNSHWLLTIYHHKVKIWSIICLSLSSFDCFLFCCGCLGLQVKGTALCSLKLQSQFTVIMVEKSTAHGLLHNWEASFFFFETVLLKQLIWRFQCNSIFSWLFCFEKEFAPFNKVSFYSCRDCITCGKA